MGAKFTAQRIIPVIELNDLVIVVRGGARELPTPGTPFSGAVGKTLEDAAAYVPHGVIRHTTIGAILAGGGSITLKPERTRSGRINERHVEVVEGSSPSSFSSPIPNPIPRAHRIQ
ncbi:MAG TPA: hypothetical protein VKF81_18135 [Blastocatellia bacterium]|nr:hypothetical protein [Blastocatellia bacterium]